jgi:hypothetical protein
MSLNQPRTTHALVDANAVASFLNVDVDFVYAHSAELGARRLGSGPRARLRFDLDEVRAWLDSCSPSRESKAPELCVVEPIRRRRAPRRLGTDVPLLPIKGSGRAA